MHGIFTAANLEVGEFMEVLQARGSTLTQPRYGRALSCCHPTRTSVQYAIREVTFWQVRRAGWLLERVETGKSLIRFRRSV
jgi:hypothetical protein